MTAAPAPPPGDPPPAEPPPAEPPPAEPPGDGAPTVLILVRHGRTVMTEQGRLCGSGRSDPPLLSEGRREAERCAGLLVARLSEIGSSDPVAAVVSSPTLRTRQTARIVADRLGLPVVADEDWTEIDFGVWDGCTHAEIGERWPGEVRAWYGRADAAPPDGQSLDELAERVRRARERTVEVSRGRTVVVVTHATPVRVTLRDALDAGPAVVWRTRIAPGSLTALRYWSDGGTEVVTVNALGRTDAHG